MNKPEAKTRTIAELLKSRMELVKYTSFGTYLECKSADFSAAHPDDYLKDYNISSLENKWNSFSANEKSPYVELTVKRNEIVDLKKLAIDKEIISLRAGKREYTGYEISRPKPSREWDIIEQLGINPIFWYRRHLHSSTYKIPIDRRWAENYQLVIDQAYREWPSLPQNEKDVFIHQAKIEYCNFNGGFSVGDDVVDLALQHALKKHAEAGKHRSLQTEYYSDDDD